ncbi:NAD-dependent epimerase/dehydratase family protein [Halotia branconii]|uniref:NAD-dependent epimerase/dehydratase family protein n=1 Tax=Halotia branconii CENA392 TaxID=1539056 RepID=A0AAJ6NTF3_9CYAN|nr:NAD-dependent epimerase/dehydratase family protein [Halotia branconii]WGV26154.1 NAD-dependent epimerase/dehydratase family protein [Halotia branconii CENA392]
MNLSQQQLLISGIDGFIGLRSAELALSQGMKIRGLQHSPEKTQKAQKLGVELLLGNITDPVIAQKACQEMDIVLHTAAVTQESGSLDYFREVNVEGTVNLAKAAKNAGVKTFVYLSSVLVYGFNYPDGVTEKGSLCGENNPYCQTTIEAEEILLQLNAPPDFNVIIIRAGDVYGPGSIPWIVRPLLLMRQKLFALANDGLGVMNHVYVDNLIEGIFLAIEKEAYGEVFNITDGQKTSWKEYFTRLAEIGGLPEPISLPASMLKSVLWQQNLAKKLVGKKADIMPDSVDFVTRPYAYSIAKAQSRLNYQPKIDLEEGMRRTQEWLQKTDIQEIIL